MMSGADNICICSAGGHRSIADSETHFSCARSRTSSEFSHHPAGLTRGISLLCWQRCIRSIPVPGNKRTHKYQASAMPIKKHRLVAQFIRAVAPIYNVPVVLHTVRKKSLRANGLDTVNSCRITAQRSSSLGLTAWYFLSVPVFPYAAHMLQLDADEAYFKLNGEPLFSSHMINLSKEKVKFNIDTTARYLERIAPMKQWLEMEIGITGGEEDGVDNGKLPPARPMSWMTMD